MMIIFEVETGKCYPFVCLLLSYMLEVSERSDKISNFVKNETFASAVTVPFTHRPRLQRSFRFIETHIPFNLRI